MFPIAEKNSLIGHITKYITYYESKTIENASKYVVANYNKFKIKQKQSRYIEHGTLNLKFWALKLNLT